MYICSVNNLITPLYWSRTVNRGGVGGVYRRDIGDVGAVQALLIQSDPLQPQDRD